jgi:hypothetical protein
MDELGLHQSGDCVKFPEMCTFSTFQLSVLLFLKGNGTPFTLYSVDHTISENLQ